MDFIIGGSHQGKREYVRTHYAFDRVADGSKSSLEEIEQAEVITEFHLLIRRLLQDGRTTEEINSFVGELHPKAVTADEIGYGLVPIDAFERTYREAAGRACCEIAKRANKVIRIVCGIPNIIKNEGIPVYLIRHGQTTGNEEKRYVGRTDESLSDRGREETAELSKVLGTLKPDVVYVSPMKRCIETARILFPDCDYKVIEDFRECDFGEFEYKNYKELDGNENYQRFIDSGGMTGFPGGELPESFRARCQEAFVQELTQLKDGVESAAFVVHGGTIMSILDAFSQPHKEYFAWQAKNANGFQGRLFPEEKCFKFLQVLR